MKYPYLIKIVFGLKINFYNLICFYLHDDILIRKLGV